MAHKARHKSVKGHHKPRVHHKPTAGRSRRTASRKPTGSGTQLTAAVTGSSGGMGVWLVVILGLVLVAGSAVGILRYRRSR
jgi:hypothetical protein